MIIKRISVIDNIKAIGILSIMLGHAPGISLSLETLLYGFHVPLFFIISGVLLSDRKLNLSSSEYLKSLVKELVIPYFFFFIVSYFYWLLTYRVSNSAYKFIDMSWYTPIQGLFVGTGHELFVNLVLWFFPALFCTKFFYFIFRKFCNDFVLLGIFLCISLVHFYFINNHFGRFVFGADCALYGVIFLTAGRLLKKELFEKEYFVKKYILIVILFVSSFIYIKMCFANGKADLNNVHIGSYFLYWPTAFLGAYIIFILAQLIPENKVSLWLSTNTLYIFPMHTLLYKVCTGLIQTLLKRHSPYIDGDLKWSFFYILFSLTLLYPVIILLRKTRLLS